MWPLVWGDRSRNGGSSFLDLEYFFACPLKRYPFIYTLLYPHITSKAKKKRYIIDHARNGYYTFFEKWLIFYIYRLWNKVRRIQFLWELSVLCRSGNLGFAQVNIILYAKFTQHFSANRMLGQTLQILLQRGIKRYRNLVLPCIVNTIHAIASPSSPRVAMVILRLRDHNSP